MSNQIEKVDPNTGEVMTMTESSQPLAVQLAQAELNQAVTTARAFPRSVSLAMKNIMSLATLDEETAEECVYALPRGGKPVKGPSIRFAEIIASQWGNCHTGSRVVDVDRFEKVVIAEGVFQDLETGMRRTAQVRRRISDKHGRLFNDDMITMTGNAAASIAMREAILKGIPKAVWRKAYNACESVISGDVTTLAESREKTLKAFHAWGITPDQIYAALEVGGIDDVGLDQIGTLRAIYKAVKDGEQKLEDYFPPHSSAEKATEAAKGTAAKLNKIADEGKEKAKGKTSNAKNEKTTQKGKSAGKASESKEPDKSSDEVPEDASQEPDGSGASDGNDENAGEDVEVSGEGSEQVEGDQAPTDEEIEAAFERGMEARKKGMSRKAVPPELRAKGKEALADAWVRGHDEQNNA